MLADAQGGLLQIFFLENLETRSASDRVAAKRAEKFHPVVKRIGDLRGGDNRRQRKGIADRLAKHDDVGNHALRFESPKMRSKTSESDLYFVGDTNRARPAPGAV